ncbi:zinc finger, CCHC-type containing protein [Tanacetum coccineum]
MASSITRFDIENFDEKNNFGLWQIKMRALMVQQGCDATLETLPVDMRPGIWTKFTSLYMIKSLANRLYLKKKLYMYYMSPDIVVWEGIFDNGGYLATLNLRELKKITEGTKEETSDGLYVRRRSNHSGKAHSGGNSRFKSRGGTGKLKCFICHSEGHLKRYCPMNKSSGFVKKDKRDQDSDSSDDEGNAYFGEAMVVVGNDEMDELVMDSGTWKVKIQLHDRSNFILEDVRYVPWLRRSLISLGTLEKEVYIVKMQMGTIKVELHGAQGNREAEVFQVSNDDAAVAQRRFKDKQLEEKTNTDCLVKEQEKVHLSIKVGANIMVTGVPGQEGAEGNVAEKKKVNESMEANLEKLLKLSYKWTSTTCKIWGTDIKVSVFLFGELVVFLFQVCYEYSLWHRDDYKDIHYKDRKHGGSRETSDCEKPGARNKDRNYSRIPIADNVAANCSPAVGLTLDSIASAFSLYGTVKGVYPADESGCRVIVSYDDETSAQTALNAFMF